MNAFTQWFKRFGLAVAGAAVPLVQGIMRIIGGDLVQGAGSVAAGAAAIIVAMLQDDAQAAVNRALILRGMSYIPSGTFTGFRLLLLSFWLSWFCLFFYQSFTIMSTPLLVLTALAGVLLLGLLVSLVLNRAPNQDANNDDESDFSDRSPAKKRALLVGINAYPNNALGGCLNDIADMKTYLRRVHGNNIVIRTLKDGKATADNIRLGLDWLLAGTNAGDVRLFHYSGHGTQLPCKTEADGYDEAIVPVDFNWNDEQTFIKDDEIHSRYQVLPSAANFTVFLDSCHSGDSLRDKLMNTSPRFIAHPTFVPTKAKVRTEKELTEQMHDSVVLIAGCKTDQTSADATFTQDGGMNRKNGAATYFLLQTLNNTPVAALTSIVRDMNYDLSKNGYSQQPQLEGSPRLQQCSFLQS